MQIAKNKETRTLEGEIVSKFELFEGDLAEDTIFTIPGFESIPLKEKKVLVARTEGGDYVVIGVPLSTAIEAGERRITSTDANGVEKSQIKLDKQGNVTMSNDTITLTIDKDGKIEIKNLTSDDLTSLINDLSTNLQTAVTDLISATVPTALGPQSLSVAIPWATPVTGLLAKTIENATKIGLYKK